MRRIFVTQPSAQLPDAECAKQIVQQFATRAFRRPASAEETKRLMTLYDAARQSGKSYEQSVKVSLMAVLVSPNFLFRMERRPEGAKLDESGAWDLTSYEIASRLSYFLWSTMPDDALMQAASEDKLRDPVQREAQVRRMLKDPRAKALAVNFAGQWLELRNLDDVVRDGKKFPGFDNSLLKSMRREAELFFENLIREDRSVMDLLTADYSFLDDRLAKLYGLPPVGGRQFKKTSLIGSGRGGVMGMAAVLTVTSNPNRTSPVKRGQYVLDQLLGTPAPPPPPNVPKLSEKAKDQKDIPLRKRLEAHRADERCAACHARMDGIGFALERFDPIGKIRDKDGDFAIDDEGIIPGASAFKGLDGLKKVLIDRKDLMLRNMTRKLMTYALGRGTSAGDRRTVEQCVKQSEKSQYSFTSLTMAIINSKAFLKRRDPRGDE